jgi:hypothetical protein
MQFIMPLEKARRAGEGARLLQALRGAALGLLITLGVAGSLYKVIAPEGWGSQLFGRGLAGGLAALLTLGMIGTCLWLTREFVPQQQKGRFSGLLAFALAATGALYLIQFFLKGSI